ncbi:hypothetical protein Pla108_16110 [Botrimarina colliarenosi]|uniref:DUF502 domain-containing protein n=1 Tax=Botrimarina colliarenosi TaxID=2528001 RepID=A0A5C6AN30_9BACT|nr:hypothetical protein [Botrimarina colliarenosi]TWU00659.1 hypothetical protein Pla108_16110 [Botrimarina colliarenosi]
MHRRVSQLLSFLRTTLVGGVVFLLPLAAVGWLLAQAVQIGWSVVSAVQSYLADHEGDPIGAYAELGPGAYALLLLASLVLLVGVAFVAGIVARRSLGQWFSERAERYLSMLFPRYAVFKDQLTGNLGTGSLQPVVARVAGWTRIAIEVERDPVAGVTVYLPSSPDPWTGTVAIVPPDAVTPIAGDFSEVMATFERLGRGTGRYVATAHNG